MVSRSLSRRSRSLSFSSSLSRSLSRSLSLSRSRSSRSLSRRRSYSLRRSSVVGCQPIFIVKLCRCGKHGVVDEHLFGCCCFLRAYDMAMALHETKSKRTRKEKSREQGAWGSTASGDTLARRHSGGERDQKVKTHARATSMAASQSYGEGHGSGRIRRGNRGVHGDTEAYTRESRRTQGNRGVHGGTEAYTNWAEWTD